jgi:hypothetical protein
MSRRPGILVFFISIFIPIGMYCQVARSSPYPKIITYTCIFLPVVSTSSKTTTWNFSNTTSIGFSTGINVLYSDRFGFSYDLGPVITTTNGLTKVSNFIFDPGPVFRLSKGYSIITRLAFETAGRFGESTVLAKVFTPGKKNSLFVSLGVPIRFGNNLPASIGATLFFGIAFK